MAGVLNKILSFAGIYEDPYDSNEEEYEEDGYYDNDGYTEDFNQDGSTLNGQFRQQRFNDGGNGAGNANIGGGGNGMGGFNARGAGDGGGGNVGGGRPNGGINVSAGRAGVKSGVSNIVNLTPQKPPNYVLVNAKPDRLEDAQLICDHLKERHVVIVNVEGLDGREAQRIVDFIGGAVYALDGEIFDITNRIFAIAPNYVDLVSIQRDSKARGFLSFGSGGSNRG